MQVAVQSALKQKIIGKASYKGRDGYCFQTVDMDVITKVLISSKRPKRNENAIDSGHTIAGTVAANLQHSINVICFVHFFVSNIAVCAFVGLWWGLVRVLLFLLV